MNLKLVPGYQSRMTTIDSMAALRNRKSNKANLYFYRSPKNRKILTVETDAVFMQCILLESDNKVSIFRPEPGVASALIDNKVQSLPYELEVCYSDGRTDWVHFVNSDVPGKNTTNYNGLTISRIEDGRLGCYVCLTKRQLLERAFQIDNWLFLVAAANRIYSRFPLAEADHLVKIFREGNELTLDEIMTQAGYDPGSMLGLVADGLRRGIYDSVVDKKLLTRESKISLASNANSNSTASPHIFADGLLKNRNEELDACPHIYSVRDTSNWPQPDENVLPHDYQEKYYLRKNEIERYVRDKNSRGALSNREVRRQMNRCMKENGIGGIVGFYACIPGYRTKEYQRRAEPSGIEIGSRGGYSGALNQIFEKNPSVQKRVDDLWMKRSVKNYIHASRITIRALHQDFLLQLRTLGYRDDQYPFNTSNRGYVSLASYVKTLSNTHYKKVVASRGGAEAAARTSIGTGAPEVFRALRPYSFMQLDYTVVDCSSIIVIKNKFGVEIDVELPRWYYGLMSDEYTGLITGIYIGMEVSPTSDSALQIIESSLRQITLDEDDPRVAYIVDGKILPNQLISELKHQCFSVLRVDNAWANAARNVVNSIINAVGCAVQFGAPRAWWTRPVVERIFGTLTQKGLQKMPSTFGSGPHDPLRTNPGVEAKKFRIMISEIIGVITTAAKMYNSEKSASKEFGSPLENISAAISHARSGFIPQPLPISSVQDPRLLRQQQIVTIKGNVSKGVRPFIKWDNCSYTNEKISSRHDLIGEKLVLYCNTLDVRDVLGTLADTGEDIGTLVPERRWRDRAVSIRFRKLINRHGEKGRMKVEHVHPVEKWQQDNMRTLVTKPKDRKAIAERKKVSSASILALANPQNKFESSGSVQENKAISSENKITSKRRAFGYPNEDEMLPVSRNRD